MLAPTTPAACRPARRRTRP